MCKKIQPCCLFIDELDSISFPEEFEDDIEEIKNLKFLSNKRQILNALDDFLFYLGML